MKDQYSVNKSVSFLGIDFAPIFAKISYLKTAIHQLSILLLAGTVLLGATGVSVHQLYCYCKGEMVASVFKPDDPCGPQVATCCQSDTCGKMLAQASSHDCSDCTSQYVKLDVDYLLLSADFKLTVPAVLAFAKLISKREIHFENTALLAWQHDLPPPLYGKALLPHIQSFLC